jgi:predicted acylesterase/phospholipase RssA
MKKIIRLTESDLHRIVRRTINEIINNVPGYVDGGSSNYNLQDYKNLKNGSFKKGYYVCVDTDYNNGGQVAFYIGDEKDARMASMSSEGYAKGPFMSEREATMVMNKLKGQYR